jgi:hypothetical protein
MNTQSIVIEANANVIKSLSQISSRHPVVTLPSHLVKSTSFNLPKCGYTQTLPVIQRVHTAKIFIEEADPKVIKTSPSSNSDIRFLIGQKAAQNGTLTNENPEIRDRKSSLSSINGFVHLAIVCCINCIK